jgi:hypothetical protein
MLDETQVEQTEQVEETSVENTDTQVEETPVQPSNPLEITQEEKKGMLESLKEKFFGKRETVTDRQEVETQEEDIDSTFTEAARKTGWNDEQIIEFASEYNNEQLQELLPTLIEPEEEEPEIEEEVKEEIDPNVDEKLKPYLEKIQKQYEAKDLERQARLEALEAALSLREQDREITELVSRAQEADSFFDLASKDFAVFGKTEELKRFPEGTPKAGQVIPLGPEYEARQAVWQMAVKMNKLGSPWKDSLNDAYAWFKGKNGEKEISKKIVKDLKKQETRLSAKRTAKKTEPKFKNEFEEKQYLIQEAAREAGIEL